MSRIANGAIERIRATALDEDGLLLTGLSDVLIEIRRKSDGFYYDFNDTTFKVSGWTTRQGVMSELDATNSAGTYYYDFDTSGLSDDEYFIRVTSVTAINVPQEGEIKVGGYIDNVKDLWEFRGLDSSNAVVLSGDGRTSTVAEVNGKILTTTPDRITRT